MKIKCGVGFDAHRLVSGRKLMLGGVEIPYEKGLDGHSDADVLIHAIIDSLAGPVLGKDIGGLFPDDDSLYKDIDSAVLLRKTRSLVREKGYNISNIDAEVSAQAPKIAPYIPKMREVIGRVTGLDFEDVTIKATTTEKMGFTGSGEGIAAMAVSVVISDS